MTMKQRCSLLILTCLLGGCGGAAQGPQTPGATATNASAPPAATTRHLGEWVMAPPPGQEREVALVRMALATPPDESGFAATHPDAKEQEHFSSVLRLRREDPGSPLLASLQRKLDQLEGVRVNFLPDKYITTTASGIDSTAYRIEEDLGNQLVLLELEGRGASESSRRRMLSFDGPDKMVITVGATRVPMVRVPAGTVPRPNEVPSVAPPRRVPRPRVRLPRRRARSRRRATANTTRVWPTTIAASTRCSPPIANRCPP
jgi:hypothetical protein